MKLPEELWATLVIAHQNLQISFCLWIAVLKNSESSGVGLHQTSLFITSWATLIIGLTFLAGKDSTYLSICKLLSRLKHYVSGTFWNFFPDFLIRNLITRYFRPYRVIYGARKVLFMQKLISVQFLYWICCWLGLC